MNHSNRLLAVGAMASLVLFVTRPPNASAQDISIVYSSTPADEASSPLEDERGVVRTPRAELAVHMSYQASDAESDGFFSLGAELGFDYPVGRFLSVGGLLRYSRISGFIVNRRLPDLAFSGERDLGSLIEVGARGKFRLAGAFAEVAIGLGLGPTFRKESETRHTGLFIDPSIQLRLGGRIAFVANAGGTARWFGSEQNGTSWYAALGFSTLLGSIR